MLIPAIVPSATARIKPPVTAGLSSTGARVRVAEQLTQLWVAVAEQAAWAAG